MRTRGPTWWPLYGAGVLLVVLLLFVDWEAPTPGWGSVLDAMVVLIMYGLMALWLRANRNVLLRADLDTDTSDGEEELPRREDRSPRGEFRHVSPG